MMNNSELLQRISRHLILNASFNKSMGLAKGKIGAILFFFHYARHTGNALYEDFAGELIEELYEDIHKELPVTFEDGLCGVAWGMEYLIQQGFVEGDSNEILEELDQRILERDVRKIKKPDLNLGLLGIAHYIAIRYNKKGAAVRLFDMQYVSELLNNMKSIVPEDEEHTNLMNCLECILYSKSFEYDSKRLLHQIIGKIDKKVQFEDIPHLGIKDSGFAGVGLKLLFEEGIS